MMQQRQWRCHQKLDWPSAAAAATAPTSLISLTAATTTTTTATTLTMVMRSAAATVDR